VSEAERLEEEAVRAADQLKIKEQIITLLDVLNPGLDRYATGLTILTPKGPQEFNVTAVFTALVAQFQHLTGYTADHNEFSFGPALTLFPDAVIEKTGETLIKRHYHFDCQTRHVRMVLTFAKTFIGAEGPTTIGQPRYDTEYVYRDPIDNYIWRGLVNWVTRQFDSRQYVHLYGHSFQYIWDGEASTSHLIPAGSEEEPNPLCSVNVE
jgi:hypothetical protein